MKIGSFSKLLIIALSSFALSGQVLADKIKVAGVYTQPLQQKWDARLHLALQAAADIPVLRVLLRRPAQRTELQQQYQ